MEVGSEFSWPGEIEEKERNIILQAEHASDKKYLFSGRTAIDFVLSDIAQVSRALLPSYCCQSMIDPFLQRGIQVDFYQVYFEKENLQYRFPKNMDYDVLLWVDYFGFYLDFPQEKVRRFREMGGSVIVDMTHSLFSKQLCHEEADYYIASLRKWGPMLCGGAAYKKNGNFEQNLCREPDEGFLADKRKAMKLKSEYLKHVSCCTENRWFHNITGQDKIQNASSAKEEYMFLFRKTNNIFATDFRSIEMDAESMEMFSMLRQSGLQRQRKENAKVLYSALGKEKNLKFLFPVQSLLTPLFVPVLLENKKIRDMVKNELVNKGFYCPVHWARPSMNGADSNLYDMELSLVCDQRYGAFEMCSLAEVVLEAVKR